MVFAQSDICNNVDRGNGDPVERVQADEITSNDEVKSNPTPMQGASLVNAVERQFAVLSLEDEQEKRIKELEARVEYLEKQNIQMEEEIQQEREQSKRVEAFMNCAICMDPVQDPQLLNCGHSACYSCLWNWWKHSYFEVEEPIPDENQDPDEPGLVLIPNNGWDDPNPTPVDFVIPPMPKVCPYCQTTILFRPAPNYVLDNMVKIMRCHRPEDDASSEDETPTGIPKKEYKWDGIFGQSVKGAEIFGAIKKELDERLPRYHREVLELAKSMADMRRLIPIVRRERDAAAKEALESLD